MGDDLIPEAEPNKGSNEAAPDKKASDERPQNTKKNIPPSHGDVVTEPKSTLFVNAILFGIIESAAFVLWQIADGLTGHVCVFVHWLSLVCISAGPLPATRTAVKCKGRLWFSLVYAFIWLLLAVVAFIIWHPKKPTSEPHFVVLLSTDDTPNEQVALTNKFFQAQYIGGILQTPVPGCVVVPLRVGKPNVLLQFWVKNDSPVLAEYVEVTVSLPTGFLCSVSSEWERVILQEPGGEPRMPELHSWEYSIPHPLHAGNTIYIPQFLVPQTPPPDAPLCSILFRAKDCPAQGVKFFIDFLPIESNAPPLKPFAVIGKPIPGSTNLFLFSAEDVFKGLNGQKK
jgi:hypothetical protein